MTMPIPKWVQERYSKLWANFGKKGFTFAEIINILEDGRETINAVLSELKGAEWIGIESSKEDLRKKIYKLKEPNEILREMKSE